MTEEHYQDGIKLPTDKDKPKWEVYAHQLTRIKVDGGYLYYLFCDHHQMCFVPEDNYYKGYADAGKDWNFPDAKEVLKMVGDLSFKLNKMQDSFREFEKVNNQHNLLEWASSNERIEKLEERADLANECFAKLDNKFTERTEKIDSIPKDMYQMHTNLNERIHKLESISHQHDDLNQEVESKHEHKHNFEHSELFENERKCKDCGKYEEDLKAKQECMHEYDLNLLLTYPSKIRCIKCNEIFSMPKKHPRDTLKLCPHGVPVKMPCTACY